MVELKTETFTVKAGDNGRLTIPEGTRYALNIKEGEYVRVTIQKIEPK